MADLIDREALMAEYDRVHVGKPGRARKLMEKATAVDAVHVVRCKDCKNWDRHIGIFDSPNGYCDMHEETVNGYDYCSYGEMKTL